MVNLSSAQGARFAEVCREMTEAVQALGPTPLPAAAGREAPVTSHESRPAGGAP